jgi:hypothetical protein
MMVHFGAPQHDEREAGMSGTVRSVIFS